MNNQSNNQNNNKNMTSQNKENNDRLNRVIKDDGDLIIEENTIYEIDRNCYEKYICRKKYN